MSMSQREQDLLKAARAAVRDYEDFMDDPDETYPEYHHEAIRRLAQALVRYDPVREVGGPPPDCCMEPKE